MSLGSALPFNDMEMSFCHSTSICLANQTYFDLKGCAPGRVLKKK